MSRNLRMLAALALVALLAGASFAVAQDGNSNERENKRERAAGVDRAHLAGVDRTVASELGVTAAELRRAMRAAFEGTDPPERPERGPGEEELRAAMEEHCTALTDAIGDELGKSGDEVREAFKAAALARIDRAEEDGRLDADDADDLRERLDGQSCVLGGPGGHHAFGPGCDGPGGPGFRGHHGPGMGGPPAGMREGSYDPAPSDGGAVSLAL
jgi:hypothetical protein